MTASFGCTHQPGALQVRDTLPSACQRMPSGSVVDWTPSGRTKRFSSVSSATSTPAPTGASARTPSCHSRSYGATIALLGSVDCRTCQRRTPAYQRCVMPAVSPPWSARSANGNSRGVSVGIWRGKSFQ